MMSNTWKVLALLGVTALAGCYGSNGQTKDGQSHWLETCSTSNDCGGGALCACGVCTIDCGSTAACGASSTCEAVDDRQACSDAPSGVSRVCLASCDDDDDCDASSLTCVADSCVGDPVSILPDGEVPSEDAGTDAGNVPDASIDPTKVQTIEGPLTCSELDQRRVEVLSALANDHRSCETERDCVCASTGTNCQYECNQSLSLLAIEEFHQSVMDFNHDYCSDARRSSICGDGDGDIDCAPCRAICVAGECTSTTREGCSITGLVCPGDQVCHIDFNCIDRGVADDNGVATLAIAQEIYLSQSNPEFMGILGLVVTSEAIYWFDSGTFDSDFNDDAALYRMAHDDDTPELLASGLGFATNGLASDATSLYYSGPDGIWSIPLAGGVEPTRVVEYESPFGTPWILHDGFVYYVNLADHFVHRVRTDGTGDELFWDNDKTVYELTASGDTVYVEVRGESDVGSSLFGFTAPDSAAVVQQIPFRTDADRGRLLAVSDQLLSDLGSLQKGLQIFEVSSATYRTIAEDAWLDQRSVSDGYVYSLESTVAGMPDMGEYYVTRTAIADGSSERLRRAVGAVGQIAVGGGYLYWIEDLRLMRKLL